MNNSSFNISTTIQKEISSSDLNDNQKITLARCVWGYSKGKDIFESLEKVQYTWAQTFSSCPDWKECSKLLDTRKLDLSHLPKDNPSNAIVGFMFMLPWMLLGYALEDSGEKKLYKLIEKNNLFQ